MTKFNKNMLYSTRDICTEIITDFPGRYRDLESCMRNLPKYIKAVGANPANGQKNFRKYTGLDAEAIYNNAAKRYIKDSFKKTSKHAEALTPIEVVIKDAVKEEKKAEPENKWYRNAEPVEKAPETKAADPDEFEAKRKKFYTDYHYFLKFAQTPEERSATVYALANLYGMAKKGG